MIIPKAVLLLRDTLLKTMHPFGLELSHCGGWCVGKPEETIVYSGCLYVAMEIVFQKHNFLKYVTENPTKNLIISLSKVIQSIKPVYSALIKTKGGRISDIPRKALEIINRIGINAGCLSEEPYAGMLLYDFGFLNDLSVYVKKVYDYLKSKGVKRIITIDPHTYDLLAHVYPQYIEDYDLEILNFIDVVLEAIKNGKIELRTENLNVTYHDPCNYSKSKWRRLIDEPREIIKSANNVNLIEPFNTRNFATCCGGPIETFFMGLAREIAKKRLSQLVETRADQIIVSCPVCLTSFLSVKKFVAGNYEILDLVEFIYNNMK